VENFCHKLNEKYIVRICECMMPREIFRPERRERRGWIKLYNGELNYYNYYYITFGGSHQRQ
jgi:hypothetical protein